MRKAVAPVGLGLVRKESPKEFSREDLDKWFNKVTKGIKKRKVVVNDEAVELVNMTIGAAEFDGFKFLDTMITYQSALAQDGVSFVEYINAIRFCAFLEANEGSVVEAYIKTFSFRDFVKNRVEFRSGSDEYRQLCSAAIRYRKSPIVINILTQAEIPLYLMFQGYRYKAVSVLADRMLNAGLDRDKINAADKLLTHLKPPENVKIELDVGTKNDDVIGRYEAMIENMAKEQKKLLESGESLNEVTNSVVNFVDVEVEER